MKTMKTLVAADRYLGVEHIDELEELGLEVELITDETMPVEDPTLYEAVICSTLFRYTPMERFTNLKFVQLYSASIDDRIDVDLAKRRGIVCYRAKGVSAPTIAEHVLCGVLDLYRHRRMYDAAQKRHEWMKRSAPNILELCGRKVCVVGAGVIGAQCAKYFKAFDCQVVGIARTAAEHPGFDIVYPSEEILEVLHDKDIVISTLPNTPATTHFFGRDEFLKMKDGAVFVNVGRGGVVDEQALIEALSSGKLRGAVLDVFEHEPLSKTSVLWDMDNVILTPHHAGRSDRLQSRFMLNLKENLVDYRSSHE